MSQSDSLVKGSVYCFYYFDHGLFSRDEDPVPLHVLTVGVLEDEDEYAYYVGLNFFELGNADTMVIIKTTVEKIECLGSVDLGWIGRDES